MIKSTGLFLIFFFLIFKVFAQTEKSSKSSNIETLFKAIISFQNLEGKRDSVLGHSLGSNSEADFLRRYSFYDSINSEIEHIDKTDFSFDEKINLELLQYSIEDGIYSYRYRAYLNPILADEGFHTRLAKMGSRILSSKKEFEEYIKELKDIPRFVDENLALMRTGLKLGISQPRIILNNYDKTYALHIVNDAEKSVFWKPFLNRPIGVGDDEWKKISDEGKNSILKFAVEGFKNIKVFFDKEYFPQTRTTIGVSNFPDGLDYYKELVHHYTTTNDSYDKIYQLGLTEVARIKKEMLEVIKEVKFNGNLKEFIEYLRTDPKFYATTEEQLMKEASYIAKKADGKLPQFFGKLPRQPYGVEPVPAHLAPTYTAGRYMEASIKSKRAGHYLVNTYDLKSRPLYTLEALTIHEAMPGHHLQFALTQELDSLPQFRKDLYVNAFGEGWGLYCEYLGTEMGFYKDPYSRFGKLTYEMWRACRLVIDVGLHAKGWSREQSVAYLSENTALSLHEVNTEINRYISWPGQALAYKIGELKIKELRKRAEEKLKDKFDIREFHDLILSRGTLTLKLLEEMVDRYIASK